MSDDRVRLHVKASVVLVSSSLVFFLILCRRGVLWYLPYNNENTDSRSTSIFRLFLSISQVYLNVILSIFLRST